MVAEVFSAMIQGIEGQIVKIQVDISNGLPNFNMIGYLSNEVKESKERVRTALNNIGVLLPPKRISVNFAPADFRKCGTSFDIGVAAAILLAMDFVPETYIKDTLFVGELSLNGQICPISGVLPIVVAASKRGIKRCIVAQENVAEAAFVEQMEVVGCRNLEELFFYLKHGYIINDDSGEILENSGNISEDSGKECTIQDVKKSQEISESTRSLNLLVKDILENTFHGETTVSSDKDHIIDNTPVQEDGKEIEDYSLSTLIRHLGLDSGITFHQADDDVLATWRLMEYCYNEYKELRKTQPSSLEHVYINSIYFWKGYNKFQQGVYLNTSLGKMYYSTFQKAWFSSNINLERVDIDAIEREVLIRMGIDSNKELGKMTARKFENIKKGKQFV